MFVKRFLSFFERTGFINLIITKEGGKFRWKDYYLRSFVFIRSRTTDREFKSGFLIGMLKIFRN